MVRKLNVSKHLHRIDLNYIEVVSDNEVEPALPDINSFMNIMPVADGYGSSQSWPPPHMSTEAPLGN